MNFALHNGLCGDQECRRNSPRNPDIIAERNALQAIDCAAFNSVRRSFGYAAARPADESLSLRSRDPLWGTIL